MLKILAAGGRIEVIFASSHAVEAHYAVADLESVVSSHVIVGGSCQWHPDFDRRLQHRVYGGRFGREAERLIVHMPLDARHVLDPTHFAGLGPPVCRPDGQVVAGNHRTLVMTQASPPIWDPTSEYFMLAASRAALFGFSPEVLDAALRRRGVLVRLASQDRDVEDWAQLNDLSDQPLSKSFDPMSASYGAARRLREDSRALVYLRDYIGTQSVPEFLGSECGLPFAKLLVAEGVIPSMRLPEIENKFSGRLNPSVCREIIAMIAARALGNIRIAETLSRSVKLSRLITPSLMALATSPGENCVWFRDRLGEAIQEHLDDDARTFGDIRPEQYDIFTINRCPPPDESRAIAGFFRAGDSKAFSLAVQQFLERTRPIEADLFTPKECVSPAPDFSGTCFAIFGRPQKAKPVLLQKSLLRHLKRLKRQPKEIQLEVGRRCLPTHVERSLEARLVADAKVPRGRGRPRRSPVGMLRAVALMRRFSIPEQQYHRHWALMPRRWNIGAWTTFVARRAEWRQGDPPLWSRILEILG